jgi:aminoglycoside phosphotransferase family enzyme
VCVDAISPPAANRGDQGVDVGLTDKLRFLNDPDSYPDHPSRVEAIETHYSWVFMTDTLAYKLKKPVRGDGFDFRSLASRRANALAELRLNRRLAADIYLAIVPLSKNGKGALAFGGPGPAIDWLVKMARLDAERMFDRRLVRGDWHYAEIEALAQRLAGFFALARPARLSVRQLTARVRAELSATLIAFSRAPEPRLLTIATPIARRLEAFLLRRAGLFRRRIGERRLVDGHGDLRPEHIYLKGVPRIIDCLEFRADLRRLDPVEELAYLALEARRIGGVAIERFLFRRYCARTGDRPPLELVCFYGALNALVRARLAIRHLAEPGARAPEEWIERTLAYLAIAAEYARFLA